MSDANTVFLILLASLALFVWGRLRYDVVALLAMLATVVSGVIGPDQALLGFGHPAVITVAAVLVISRGLRHSGIVEIIAGKLEPYTHSKPMHIAVLTLVVAACSGFMNNVGALALMLPVALHTASARKHSPSILLMPLAFGSILGGLVTMMGTPPNIIIATYRAEISGEPFSMFAFTPVGAAVALAGVAFVALIGWRLIPRDRLSAESGHLFEIREYILEVRVKPESPLVDQRLGKVEQLAGEDLVVMNLVRNRESEIHPSHRRILQEGDILVVKAEPKALSKLAAEQGLEMITASSRTLAQLESRKVHLMEAVVSPGSPLEGQSALYIRRWSGRRIHLLALARQGRAIRTRLRSQYLRPGDVCLLQAEEEGLGESLKELQLLPLAERELALSRHKHALPAVGIFGAALLISALGWLPVAFAFIAAIIVYIFMGILPMKDLYKEIDWPVLVLLGAMIPVGQALELSGGTKLLAAGIVNATQGFSPAIVLALVLVVTMTLSDVINNAATAVVMAPIAVGIAQQLGANTDPFLMAVAIGASCAFLTPIGHQSNTLVLGPGGYRFGDYWRMGLPLEILITAVAVPMILWVWPL